VLGLNGIVIISYAMQTNLHKIKKKCPAGFAFGSRAGQE
jgi:hypothetical protein